MVAKSMLNKMIKIGKHALYILISNVIYGLILYFGFVWLAGYSPIYAYFYNLALIIGGIAIDEYMITMLQSKKIILQLKDMQLKDKKDFEINYHLIQRLVENYVSFKTVLYLFYVVILIISPIIDSNPALVGAELGNFILANHYSIMFLIAVDMIITQFSKDRERMKEISAKLNTSLFENHD